MLAITSSVHLHPHSASECCDQVACASQLSSVSALDNRRAYATGARKARQQSLTKAWRFITVEEHIPLSRALHLRCSCGLWELSHPAAITPVHQWYELEAPDGHNSTPGVQGATCTQQAWPQFQVTVKMSERLLPPGKLGPWFPPSLFDLG